MRSIPFAPAAAMLFWLVVPVVADEQVPSRPAAAAACDCLYVSPNGNDGWSGKFPVANPEGTDGPLATLPGARDALRKLRSAGDLQRPMRVMLLEGAYRLDEPFVLTGEDSGTSEAPITFTSFPGHSPVLSGGRPVTGWKPFRGEILAAEVPKVAGEGWDFRQLFFDGRRQVRAGWPNRDPDDPLYSGWAFVEAGLPQELKEPLEFRFTAQTQPQRWAQPQQVEVNVFPWYCWVNDLIPVKQVDLQTQTLTLARGGRYGGMTLPMPGNRFRVENALEELDQPGEWCFDRDNGVWYFWPPNALDNKSLVVAPLNDTLIELRGSAERPVEHITISGLTFIETRTTFPEQLHDNFHSPLLRGAAVRLEHCRDCTVLENTFRNLGGDAVRLDGPNAHNEVVGNEIAEVGGAGISLAGSGAINTDTWADEAVLRNHSARYPKLSDNRIANNHIHHCGVFKKNGGGIHIYAINSVDNVVAHNLIHHMPDKGVVMQDGFGRVIVEYNEMYQLGQEIADTGGIMVNRWFVLKEDPELTHGGIFRFNLIRDVAGCGAYAEQRHPKGEGDRLIAGGKIWSPYYAWGIYFDNSGMENTVYGNIIVSTVLGAISMPVGSPKNNRVENNIFVESSGNQLDLRMNAGARGNRFLRNIVCYASPKAMLLATNSNAPQAVAECDYNLYWSAAGQEPRVRGIGQGIFADWKKLGFDQHSLVADPRLVDPENGDYRLRPESPAFQLGFRPIDVEQIGLREPYRSRFNDSHE